MGENHTVLTCWAPAISIPEPWDLHCKIIKEGNFTDYIHYGIDNHFTQNFFPKENILQNNSIQ